MPTLPHASLTVSRLPSLQASDRITEKPIFEPGTEQAEAGSFQSMLSEAVNRVQNFQANAEQSITMFLAGGDVDLHQVAINVQKAETTFELFAEVRNKVVQAYQEVMRTQV